MQPADKTEYPKLLDAINKSKQSAAESLSKRFFNMLDTNYTYAKATGNSHFFVTTLSKLGKPLLKRYQLTFATLNHLQQEIERGLSLEPMNRFIWMLWANYLEHLAQQDAQEWVLREMVRLFPDDKPSRVELARLLMRQGDDKQAKKWLRDVIAMSPENEPSRVELARLLMRQGDYKQAEKWLRDVIAISPDHGPSRVVLAKLLVKQDKTLEAKDLLTTFLTHNPQNPTAREVLKRIQQGRVDFTETDLVKPVATSPVNKIKVAESPLLQELKRRAVLHIAFEHEEQFEIIQQNAVEGDALACFYRQWLKPHEDLKPPPHAWAAHACRLYQTTDASAMQWEQLNRDFPEKQLLNRFLQVRQTGDQDKSQQLLNKLAHDSESLNPLEKFMFQVLQPNHGYTHDKDKSVLSVLSSAAIGAPQVESELLAA